MQSCPACYKDELLITLHDDCKFCSSCITTWAEAQILQSFQKFTLSINCLTENCQKNILIESCLAMLDFDQAERLNSTLCTRYLTRTSDILACSKKGCNYAGFATATHFGCKTPFICEACKMKWEHPLVNGTSDSFLMKVKNFMYKEFKAKRCPNCKISITKSGGCDHMSCSSCHHSYDWNKTKYRGWAVCQKLAVTILIGLTIPYSKSIFSIGKMAVYKVTQPGIVSASLKVVGSWILDILTLDSWVIVQGLYHFLINKIIEKRRLSLPRLEPIFHLPPFALFFWVARKYPEQVKRIFFRGVVVPAVLMITFVTSAFGFVILTKKKRR